MRRCDLARGRREWVALLLALLAKQEGHGAGFAALGTLQWQRVPATHAFGLHGGGQARGMGGVELVRAGIGIRLVRLEIGGAGWRARALAGELVLWALDGGCAHVKGAGVEVQVQVQVQCKMPNANVGHQAGCGVSWASATFGRCWCRGCTALGVVGDETAERGGVDSAPVAGTRLDLTECG